LLSSEDEALLVGWNTVNTTVRLLSLDLLNASIPLLVLDLSLDVIDGVRGLDL